MPFAGITGERRLLLCCYLSSVAVPPTWADTRMEGSVATGKLTNGNLPEFLVPHLSSSLISQEDPKTMAYVSMYDVFYVKHM